jgi:hypothetical protein
MSALDYPSNGVLFPLLILAKAPMSWGLDQF